jgi:hypothetical protein
MRNKYLIEWQMNDSKLKKICKNFFLNMMEESIKIRGQVYD